MYNILEADSTPLNKFISKFKVAEGKGWNGSGNGDDDDDIRNRDESLKIHGIRKDIYAEYA